MDPDSTLALLLSLFAALAVNALFVTAEFALLTLRRSSLEQSAREGDRRALRLLATLDGVEELSIVAQLGRSAASLWAGYAAAVLGLRLLPGAPSALAAVALGIALATLLHALLAEQVPKLLGMQHPRGVAAHLVVGPLRWLGSVLRPLVWLLARALQAVAGVSRLRFPGLLPLAHTPEEIQLLVAQGHEQGVVEEDEREMIHGVFGFSDTVAREVMTPRIDIVAVPVESTLRELVELLIREGHSRVPVYEGSIDTVVGVLLAKDLLPLLGEPERLRGRPFDLRRVMREAYFVPDTKPVDDILAEFRARNVHLAIVLDEFGGTYGLVTMEDLLEEIVGEINDEHDVAEPEFSPTPEGDVLIDGGAAISEVNQRFGLSLPEEDFDTIGGFIFGTLGRVPVPGDEVEAVGPAEGAMLLVEEIEDRRVLRVRLTRLQGAARAAAE